MLNYLLISLALTLISIHMLKPLAIRVGLLDHPGGRRQHQVPAQLTGGIAITLSVILLGLLAGGFEVRTLILPLTLMLLVGMFDDFVELRATHSLLFQCLVGLLLATNSGLGVEHLGNLVGLGDLGTGWLALYSFIEIDACRYPRFFWFRGRVIGRPFFIFVATMLHVEGEVF